MALIDLVNAARCRHVHYNGKPCKAPARRGRNYCMFHESAHHAVGHLAFPIVEDTHSMQLAIIRILYSLAEDQIDPHKASVMLYGLQLAGMNMKQFAQERRDIEDPERAISNKAYATFLSRKMNLPVPTNEEIDRLLADAQFEMPAERADLRPGPVPGVANPPLPEPEK